MSHVLQYLLFYILTLPIVDGRHGGIGADRLRDAFMRQLLVAELLELFPTSSVDQWSISVDDVVREFDIEAVVRLQADDGLLRIVEYENVVANNMVETARFGKYTGAIFHMKTVVEDDPAFVHAAHPKASSWRCDIAVIDDIARPVRAMGAVFRWGSPHSISISAMLLHGFDDAIFDEIFVRPAGMPLRVRIVENAIADDTAGGRPLKQRRMAIFERLDAVDEAVPTVLPTCVGRSAAAFEPCVAEDAVANFAEFRLLAIDRKTAAFDDFHVLRPTIPGICEQHR